MFLITIIANIIIKYIKNNNNKIKFYKWRALHGSYGN